MTPKSKSSQLNEFKVFGPFELERVKGTKILDPEASEASIRKVIEKKHASDNLLEKGGCYIFAIRVGGHGAKKGSYTPWYVGKAVRQPLFKESLHSEKWKKCYGKLAAKHGTPVLFWIAKAAPGHKNALNKREIAAMEKELIKAAALCNPELVNKHNNTALSFEIDGVPLGAQRHQRARKGPAKLVWTMLDPH